MDRPMRGVRAAIACPLAALAMPGCMRTTDSAAGAQPRSNFDAVLVGERWF